MEMQITHKQNTSLPVLLLLFGKQTFSMMNNA